MMGRILEDLHCSNGEKNEKDERKCISKSRITIGLVAAAAAATNTSK